MSNENKPYILTIQIRARNLDDAMAQGERMISMDGLGSGRLVSVVQKYRMTNVGTEWFNDFDPDEYDNR